MCNAAGDQQLTTVCQKLQVVFFFFFFCNLSSAFFFLPTDADVNNDHNRTVLLIGLCWYCWGPV